MEEIEVQLQVDGHVRRNQELRKTLLSYGVLLDQVYTIEHHFWAGDRMAAALLARALYERTF